MNISIISPTKEKLKYDISFQYSDSIFGLSNGDLVINNTIHNNLTLDSSPIVKVIDLNLNNNKLILIILSSSKILVYEFINTKSNLLYTFDNVVTDIFFYAQEIVSDCVGGENGGGITAGGSTAGGSTASGGRNSGRSVGTDSNGSHKGGSLNPSVSSSASGKANSINSNGILIFDDGKKLLCYKLVNRTRNLIGFDLIKTIIIKERLKKIHLHNDKYITFSLLNLVILVESDQLGLNKYDDLNLDSSKYRSNSRHNSIALNKLKTSITPPTIHLTDLPIKTIPLPPSFSYFKKSIKFWIFSINPTSLLIIKDNQIMIYNDEDLESDLQRNRRFENQLSNENLSLFNQGDHDHDLFEVSSVNSREPTFYTAGQSRSSRNPSFNTSKPQSLLKSDPAIVKPISIDHLITNLPKLEKIPLDVIFIHPMYILLLYPKHSQIIDLKGDLIQSINLNNLALLSSYLGTGFVSISAGSNVTKFKILEYKNQIDQFSSISGKLNNVIGIKEPKNDLKLIGIEKAILLIKNLTDGDEFLKIPKQLHLRDLYKKKMIVLFESYGKYHQSLVDIGSEWLISYNDILPLFPDFLNGQIQLEAKNDNQSVKTSKSYNKIKQLSVKDIQIFDDDEKSTLRSFDFAKTKQPIEKFYKAVNSLIIYLTESRRIHLNLSKGPIQWKGIKVSASDIYQHSEDVRILDLVGSVIDTSLFLCYYYCKPMLLGPLLRIPGNKCNAQVVNQVLLKNLDKRSTPKFIEELLDFYYNRNLHKEALEMLYKLSHENDKRVSNPELTIQYLVKLDHERLDLILQYAYWVIDEEKDVEKMNEYAQRIFMNETYECENHDHVKVLDFISQVLKNDILAITYLEWVIFGGDEESYSKNYHTLLALLYLQQIKKFDNPIKSDYYQKLFNFLKGYQYYESFKVLKSIPTNDDAYVRLTIFVYKRLGEHVKAIEILLNQLNDIDGAIEYCGDVYDGDHEKGKELMHKLLDDVLNTKNYEDSVIKLLKRQGGKMDILRVLTSLPNIFPLGSVAKYLENKIRQNKDLLTKSRINSSLSKVKMIKEQDKVVEESVGSYSLDSSNQKCPICLKTLGYSVFSVLKTGQVTHFKCQEDAK